MSELYTALVTVTGGRDGRAAASDGLLDVALAIASALGGPGGATNPEQLFAAGFAACFLSSIQFVARQRRLTLEAPRVAASVALRAEADGRYGLRARLAPELPGLVGEERAALLAEAERICAYSNATRGQVALAIE